MKKSNYVLLAALCVVASACKYSNQFTGTLNGESATVSVKAKNIYQGCVDAVVTTNSAQAVYSISATTTFNPTNAGAAKVFTTKNTVCNSGAAEYVVGTRTPKVLNAEKIVAVESEDNFYCQTVAYKEYTYQEELAFDVKSVSNDQTISSFKGNGKKLSYIDYSNPELIGDRWVCGYPYAFD